MSNPLDISPNGTGTLWTGRLDETVGAVDCDRCGVSLAYEVDGDWDGERYVFCGNDPDLYALRNGTNVCEHCVDEGETHSCVEATHVPIALGGGYRLVVN